MQPGPLIDKGFTAEVYAWGEGRVLKLFLDGVPPADAEREFKATRAVHDMGYPSPAAYEVVTLGTRTGVIMERIDGPCMVKVVEARPWRLFAAARLLAELHANLHGRASPAELPTQHQQIERRIGDADLPEADKRAALELLAKLPEGTAMCHGDFHPANVIIAGNGPVLIDWGAAARGHPLGDVAWTVQLFKYAELPKDSPWHLHMILKFGRALLLREYLKRYFQLRPGSMGDLHAWDSAQKAASFAYRFAKGV